MFDLNALISEFDPQTRIIHLTARHKIRAITLDEGLALKQAVGNILEKHLSTERGYLVTDYTKIEIEPVLNAYYAREVKLFVDSYLHPGGIARYGLSISRATARAGHADLIGGDPNLFNTKEEAFSYIHRLINADEEAPVIGSQSKSSNEEPIENKFPTGILIP
ncbi:MAG: hypothetical protein GY841_23260 [FCB group bacterium]|nr:hypothetical protein [FCB group bacterium]